MKKKIFIYALWIAVLLILQESIFIHFKILDVSPNLLLAFVFCFSFFSNERQALVLGLVVGLVVDIFCGRLIGPNALLMMYSALVASLLNISKFKNSILYLSIIAMPYFAIYSIIEYFFVRLLHMITTGSGVFLKDFKGTMVTRIFPEILYNVIIFIVLLYPMFMTIRFIKKRYV